MIKPIFTQEYLTFQESVRQNVGLVTACLSYSNYAEYHECEQIIMAVHNYLTRNGDSIKMIDGYEVIIDDDVSDDFLESYGLIRKKYVLKNKPTTTTHSTSPSVR